MLTAPLESPLTRVEEDLRGEAVALFVMVGYTVLYKDAVTH